jgi:hypothetical protein
MPKYVIERELPALGQFTLEQLQRASHRSALRSPELKIQWVQSYVTDNKIYCIYIAPNEQLIREHASRTGFRANRISEITDVIDPMTAEDKSGHPEEGSAA